MRFATLVVDVMLEGDCDSVFLDLIEELGWLQDLAAHRDKMCENSKTLLDGRLALNGK